MALNLVDLTTRLLGGDVLSQLSGMLGESSDKTQSAVSAAVPAVVAGMAAKAAEPEGLQAVMSSLKEMDWERDLLEKLPDFLRSGGQDSLLQAGRTQLDMLLGSRADNVAEAIGRESGLSESAAGTVLGLVTPIAMSVLGKQQNDLALDDAGLSKLLTDQKSILAGALPAALANAVGDDSLVEAAEQARIKAASIPDGADPLAARVAASGVAEPSGSFGKTIMILIALAVIVWLIYKFVFAGDPTPAQ